MLCPPASPNKGHLPAPELLKKLAIWVLFILFLYLTRGFFFTGFMTFLFSYLALGLVGWGMNRLAGGRIDNASGEERGGLRRLMTVGVFVLVPLVILGLGILIAPRLLHQGQQLAGWLSR